MSDPLITPDDLGTYLNDASIQDDRAALIIEQAQQACETIVSPFPAEATFVLYRVAARAYTSAASRGAQMAAAGSPFGGTPTLGGVWLSRSDIADLRRVNGGGGAFTIDVLPDGYVAPVRQLLPGDAAIYGGELADSFGFDQIP